jgi:hypothetical protein
MQRYLHSLRSEKLNYRLLETVLPAVFYRCKMVALAQYEGGCSGVNMIQAENFAISTVHPIKG